MKKEIFLLFSFLVLKPQSSIVEKIREPNNSGSSALEMNDMRGSGVTPAEDEPRSSREAVILIPDNDNTLFEEEQQFSSTRNTAAPKTKRLKSTSTDVSSVNLDEEEEEILIDAGREDDDGSPSRRSAAASFNEEKMRRRLQFFFMNPIEKWQAKRRFPYKFFVQVSHHRFILKPSFVRISLDKQAQI